MFNYSFWADEAGISSIALQLMTGKLPFFAALNALHYQKLHVLIVSLFLKIFGVSEFVARLPSLIGYLIGIIVIFFLAKRLSNLFGGILTAFVYAFSHLNLAYATQAKPYITIEAIILLVIYLLSDKKKVNHLLVIILCSVATLLHSIGVLIWGVYFAYLVSRLKSSKVQKLDLSNLQTFKLLNLLIIFTLIFISFVLILPIILSSLGNGQIFPFNHLYQSVKLFAYKYSFILVSAFFGFIWTFKEHKEISIAILFYSIVVFFMATFRVYIFNIRYVLSLFGIIFLYFGIFWADVGKHYFPKKTLADSVGRHDFVIRQRL